MPHDHGSNSSLALHVISRDEFQNNKDKGHKDVHHDHISDEPKQQSF